MAVLATVTACSTNRQVEFAPSATRSATTVTVTLTTTVTPSTTASSTPPPTSTSPGLTPPGATLTPAATAPPAAVGSTPFNRQLAEQQYSTLVVNVTIIDKQFATGASPAMGLDVLADDFDALATFGVPPGLDGPSYLARLNSLELFAGAAALEVPTDPARARARYDVVRRETGLLLEQVNTALKTTYTLPPVAKGSSTATS